MFIEPPLGVILEQGACPIWHKEQAASPKISCREHTNDYPGARSTKNDKKEHSAEEKSKKIKKEHGAEKNRNGPRKKFKMRKWQKMQGARGHRGNCNRSNLAEAVHCYWLLLIAEHDFLKYDDKMQYTV